MILYPEAVSPDESENPMTPRSQSVRAANTSSKREGFIQLIAAISRFGLAIVWLASGWLKLSDLMATQQAISAYELVPSELVYPLAVALPALELVLGLLFLVGLFLRPVAVASMLIFALFIAGIASAWMRGLSIDCGCFGGGGQDPDAGPVKYATEIGRDLLFIIGAIIVVRYPFRRLALHP